MLIPIIMAGGYGTRLWPLSRHELPKQFYPFFGELSLFQKTCLRVKPLLQPQTPLLVVGQESHRFIIAEQLRQIDCQDVRILLEYEPKNTAPAIALAAWHAKTISSNPTMLVLSSDHLIEPESAFVSGLDKAIEAAAEQQLVTFGIEPTSPATGYGYIQVTNQKVHEARKVAQFIEKPTLAKAQALCQDQNVYWNSGMFVFQLDTFLQTLKEHAPTLLAVSQKAMQDAKSDLDFVRPDKASFAELPADSIDYCLMEKASNIAVVPLAIDWTDVGSFSSLAKQYQSDPKGNTTVGDVALYESQNCHVHACQRMVVTLGVDNLAVIEQLMSYWSWIKIKINS